MPRHPGRTNLPLGRSPGRPKGSRNKRTLEIQEAAKRILESPTYQQNLKKRLISGTAPHMETLLHYYAYGKPIERHEVTGNDGGPIELAPARERVSQRLEEMAVRLETSSYAITSSPMGDPSDNGASSAAE